MYSREQRELAIETFIKFDHSVANTIRKLGYRSRFPCPTKRATSRPERLMAICGAFWILTKNVTKNLSDV